MKFTLHISCKRERCNIHIQMFKFFMGKHTTQHTWLLLSCFMIYYMFDFAYIIATVREMFISAHTKHVRLCYLQFINNMCKFQSSNWHFISEIFIMTSSSQFLFTRECFKCGSYRCVHVSIFYRLHQVYANLLDWSWF